MKSRVGLAISVGLNFGLAGVLGWLWWNPPVTQDASPEGLGGDTTTSQVQIEYVGRPEFRFPTNGFPRLTWKAIESTNYIRYIQNLRAVRCPEKTIQDIILADVNDAFANRWQAELKRLALDFKYWQTGDHLPGFPDAAGEVLAAELDAERRALLKELLDLEVTDSVVQFGALDPTELTLSFLPEDRRRQVVDLQREFARAQAALFAGTESDDIEGALGRLRDEHQRKLAALMSADELRRYEMTTSPLAMALRSELAGTAVSEEEFLKLYEARKEQEAELEATRVFLGAQIQAQEAQEAADQELEARRVAANTILMEQLGPERYAQLKRDADPNYDLLMQVSRSTQFPPEAASRLYEYQQISSVAADRVRANHALSIEEREIALNRIRAETERTIRESMGDSGLRLYREWNEQQVLRLAAPVR